MQDLSALWNKFMAEKIAGKIPNKVGQSIYCIYTDYEKDHTKPYTAILGCQVEALEIIPAGMIGKTIGEATYKKHTAKGNILQGIIFNEWKNIWSSDLNRAFTADFEVYGEKVKDPENAEVDIYVAVK